MLHRFPIMRSYMGPEFIKLLDDFLQAKSRIKESIDMAAAWQQFNESAEEATGMAYMPTVTLTGQKRP